MRQLAPTGLPLPRTELCLELVELYFDFIHDKFHSIFHRPSLTEDVRQGVVPPVILFAIFALSARFSENEAFSGIAPRERSKPFYDESARLVDIRDTSISTIQACILLGGIGSCEGLAFNESVYYTVACRMANLLGLSMKTGATALEQELNIRSESAFIGSYLQDSNGVSLVDTVYGGCMVIQERPSPTSNEPFLGPSPPNRRIYVSPMAP